MTMKGPPPKGNKPLTEQQKELLKIMAREAARQFVDEETAKQPPAAAGNA